MNKPLALALSFLALQGCQTFSALTTPEPAAVSTPAEVAATPEKHYRNFERDTLYALLVAELAGQRNRFDIALGNYVQQAHLTQDAGVAERAYHIADYLGASQAALDSAEIWVKQAPESIAAQRAAAIQLARAGKLDASLVHMEKVLQGQGKTHFDFLALSAAETDSETRQALLKSFDRLLEKYPDNNQLVFAKALLLHQEGDKQQALALLESQPSQQQDTSAIVLRAQLLNEQKRSKAARKLLAEAVTDKPDNKRLRLTYARLLIEQGKEDAARDEFVTLVELHPADNDLILSLGLLELQLNNLEAAREQLNILLNRGEHLDVAHFNLGNIASEQKDNDAAIEHFSQVQPGNEYLPAQMRLANLLLASGRYQEAQGILSQARAAQPDYAIQLYLIEAEGLAEHNQVEQAWAVMAAALSENPDDLDLIYTRAMLAEKRGDLDQLERDLRLIIEREPNNAMALNALGYTLADRTTRYQEALELIQAAHTLNSSDPAIVDSLGWVHYRLGQLDEAERLLRQAYAEFPDHEVAAHLGEVLWQQGKRDEAQRIWQEALKDKPASPLLQETMQRLQQTAH
ncbi:tetratricopeptide repeat protein [Atopomonas sediminilitoris]|uniref:tetratricopeptide repeat protein n=1 Tax=Atopomonas sediminilitoris TaxID=2919919 RepID=UPI001F4D4007|nr:tetratricopeptide repeat protein [Atopomonas sediminilitoris]MCJ8169640.1 tetratricopeptide repeat protein [Atopomonas sediminilitoris]